MHFRQKIRWLVLGASLITFLQAQKAPEFHGEVEPDIPNFYYEVNDNPVANRDSIAVDIILQVPFDAVQFIKKDSLFIARYEISILLLDENEVHAASKIWTQEIKTALFSETTSSEYFDINRVHFRLRPSKYFLTIGILDLDTRKSSYRKKKIDFLNYYKRGIAIGNINILEGTFIGDDGKTEAIPSVVGLLNDTKPEFDIAFTLLSKGGRGSVSYKILNMSDKIVMEKSLERQFIKGLSNEKITISKSGLTYKKYKIIVTVKIGNEEAVVERVFQLRWLGMSNLIDNLDQAIEQLKFIAPSNVLRNLRKAKDSEKKNLFIAFWKERDPTPNTEENELMTEYYKRVNYATEHFSGFLEGWKTDMGMVFILFGPPNDIERHPFEIQTKPYEIWYYYDINRSFVFVDESGFGEYRLITPLDLYDRY